MSDEAVAASVHVGGEDEDRPKRPWGRGPRTAAVGGAGLGGKRGHARKSRERERLSYFSPCAFGVVLMR